MRQICCSVVSAVVFRLLFVFFMLEFGVVGATLGAIAGVVIGWSQKTRFMPNAIIGAVSGTALSYKLTKATFDHLNSDDNDELSLAVNLLKIIYGHLEIILGGDEHKIMGFDKIPFGKGYSLEWTESYWSWKHCDY
ncbi:hypothetical protein CTI12_AA495690 [Artemisia annua]|uniref:Uncharacterized protein n=1 Tax=Artemisia annua TaxID=35608 RepID=A0A2U1LG91_ARTAN|nr:hypothetical protein CTI12_AA495690 [Artemisia annua]